MTFMEQKLKCDVYIGKNLQRLREKFGLSQEKLCAELQCTIATLVALLMPNMKTVN